MFTDERYHSYCDALRGERMPLAFIDLGAFDANIDTVRRNVEASRRTVRLGSKSIRCEPLMRRIFEHGGPSFRGLLTFTVAESAWLASKGHDNMIVAYPTLQPADLALLVEMARAGGRLSLMVDCPQHLQALSEAGRQAGVELCACIEIDMAYRPLGVGGLHLGLRRSPLRTPEQALALARAARELPNVRINALMGYEGHIAGVNDAVPGAGVKNGVMRFLKRRSVAELTRRRQQVVVRLRQQGVELEIVNGGGSGSLLSTLADPSISEVTVGSGFYCSALFHHFKEVQYHPAAFFAIQVVRRPAPGMLTCQGGGYVASGPGGWDRLPLPVLPVGLKYLPLEGAGEVQTPLLLPPACPELALGEPVFFQHAKAGELCERFNELLLLQDGAIVGRVPTYRGEGQAFL